MLTEHNEQCAVVRYCEWRGIRLYAIPNGGSRHYLEAKKLKEGGVRPGVPDLCFPAARKGYHGLYVEMKREKGGRVSSDQIDWITYLAKEGYLTAVCKGFDEAKKVIDDYFSLKGEVL